MPDVRRATVYRLAPGEAIEAVLAWLRGRGIAVPSALEGGRIDLENGVVAVTVVEAPVPSRVGSVEVGDLPS